MGLFGKKTEDDPIAVVTRLAIDRFKAHGVSVEVKDPTAGIDTSLVDPDGQEYGLYNLFLKTQGMKGRARKSVVAQHVDSMTQARNETPVEELTDAQMLERIRVRVAPMELSDALDVAYARPFAPGLQVVLCVDNPTVVTWISDGAVAKRDVDALFAAGWAHVMAEPFDEIVEIAPGLIGLLGDSVFTATKVLGLAQLLGSVLPRAPFGVAFGVPHREALFVHILSGPESVTVVGQLANLVANVAYGDAPGGTLSGLTYFLRDGNIEAIGGVGEDGTVGINGTGRFLESIEEALAVKERE